MALVPFSPQHTNDIYFLKTFHPYVFSFSENRFVLCYWYYVAETI